MLKYYSLALLLFLAASCKKETVTPVVPPPPVIDTSSANAVFSLRDGNNNCYNIAVEGSYIAGVALTQQNRLVLNVNVVATGNYSLVTETVNGYKFSAAGSFNATGEQQVILQGSGIPVNVMQNNIFIVTPSSVCSVIITVLNTGAPNSYTEDNDHMYFGNISNAAAIVDSANNYLMRKPYYTVSYSRDRGTPNWVSWHLFADDIGSVSRQDDFREDISLPAGWYQVPPHAYSSTGFDKGHNTPSGDRTNTTEANSATFLMTNMIPQAPYHNQIVWARMEDSLRRLVSIGYEVYIIMGAYGRGGTGTNGFVNTIDGGRVTVPANIWKVAIAIPNGNNDSARVDEHTRVIAVDVPNTTALTSNWKNYRVSVDAIEAVTGYDLLTRLPQNLQAALEARVDEL